MSHWARHADQCTLSTSSESSTSTSTSTSNCTSTSTISSSSKTSGITKAISTASKASATAAATASGSTFVLARSTSEAPAAVNRSVAHSTSLVQHVQQDCNNNSRCERQQSQQPPAPLLPPPPAAAHNSTALPVEQHSHLLPHQPKHHSSLTAVRSRSQTESSCSSAGPRRPPLLSGATRRPLSFSSFHCSSSALSTSNSAATTSNATTSSSNSPVKHKSSSLRRLTAVGRAVVTVRHQNSAPLLQQFSSSNNSRSKHTNQAAASDARECKQQPKAFSPSSPIFSSSSSNLSSFNPFTAVSPVLLFYDAFSHLRLSPSSLPAHPVSCTSTANSCIMANDSKYKSYIAAIDKALKSFEYTSEWADLVSALSKLQKVLNSNVRYKYIPRRFIVGQRLAQCMHPLLPSGVHLKALETYDTVFDAIGEERLLAELTIFSNGLFPLLTNAAINVRPAILDLYEKRLLPLSDRLKPALDGFLIGVLPCYEEGSDIFKRTDTLLMKVGVGVGMAYFYDSLWRCILHNSCIRLPAINFVIGHFNKKRSLAEQAHMLGLCMQTVVRAICASLLDSKILVQRAILDLLITCFPLHLNLSNEMEQALASPATTTATATTATATTELNPTTEAVASGGGATWASSSSLTEQQPQQPSGCRSAEPNASPVAAPKLHPQQPPSFLALPASQSSQSQSCSTGSIPRQHFKRSELVAIITAALTVLLRRDLSLNRRLQSWFFGSDAAAGSGSSSSGDRKGSSASSSSSDRDASAETAQSSQNVKLGSSANLRKSKRTVYFENYARSLVVEAFKRCITNPLSAITSILPATAITNSFITFTMPLTSTTGGTAHSTSHPSMAGHFPLHQSAVASPGSSPSTSTTSLFSSGSGLNRSNSTIHHHQRTRHVIASSFSQSSMTGESYSTTNSTFWPYRLLICILDQRDIATPILESLCIDIFRGLFHEFELLTTAIPPPSAVSTVMSSDQQDGDFSEEILSGFPVSSSSSPTESDVECTSIGGGSSDEGSNGEETETASENEDEQAQDSSSSLSTSIAAAVGSTSALSSSDDVEMDDVESSSQQSSESNDESSDEDADGGGAHSGGDQVDHQVVTRRPSSSTGIVKSKNRSHGKARPHTGSTSRKSSFSHSRKLSSSSNSSKRTAISASAPTVASVDLQQSKLETSTNLSASSSIFPDTADKNLNDPSKGELGFSKLAGNDPVTATSSSAIRSVRPASLDAHSSSELEDSGEDSKKNRLNLFTNFSNNVKTKSATMIRKLQRPFDGSNSNRSSIELPLGSAPPESKMKTALKTLPLVKQLKHQLDKSKSKKKLAKSRLSASVTPNLMASGGDGKVDPTLASTSAANASAASAAAVPRITIFEDEHCFQLPHQHYYWNQYYQQLDKFQRRELLKELDRVMHLLITNIGVEFIWSKLAQIFQNATEEAVSLKKLLRMIIKNVKHVELTAYSSEESDGESSYDDDHAEDDHHHSHSSDSDDPDYDPNEDTDPDSISVDSSLSWAKSLASSLLTEFITDCQQQLRTEHEHSLGVHSGKHGNIKKPRAASSLSSHSSSSSPIHFRRATLPASFAETAAVTSEVPYSSGGGGGRRLRSSSKLTAGQSSTLHKNSLPTHQLKHKLLCGLSGRCRSCHATLPFVSPVQPVGSDSVTVLEACTLVRFLLGDSRPYNHPNVLLNDSLLEQSEQFVGSMAGSSAFFSSSNISNTLMSNSVSASINRCSALEPLAVETSNYHFLIQFLDQALKQMSARAKSFAPVDLRASVELCLALCAKLKPAIMQTFVQRYRQSLNEHLRASALGAEGADVAGGMAAYRRKTSIGAWFAGNFERSAVAAKKTRSSSTASSKKQLEQVKEEDEDHDEEANREVPPVKNNDDDSALVDTVDGQMQFTDINDDIKMEQVVDGVLNFFVVFVESILVKSDRVASHRLRKASGQLDEQASLFTAENTANLPDNALRLLHFYRNSICAFQSDTVYGAVYASNKRDQRQQATLAGEQSINVRHQLLPIYEQLCELLVEVGTVPLLTSPAFLLKRRALFPGGASNSSNNYAAPFSETHLHQFARTLLNFSPEVAASTLGTTAIGGNSNNSTLTALASNSNVRWFIYLLVLSANRLSSCSNLHQSWQLASATASSGSSNSQSSSCCALRHIAYTSLSTILDLLTLSRAYLGAQQSAASALATSTASSGLSHNATAAAAAAASVDVHTKLPTASAAIASSSAAAAAAAAYADQLFSSLTGSSFSYTDMSLVDLFPGTLTARKLNFFPLIHPDLLDHLFLETVWFKMVAVRLWSNLSPVDSTVHFSTAALLQQLHSISAESTFSVCEAVLCDEMTGGEHFANLVEESLQPPAQPFSQFGYYGVAGKLKLDNLFTARSRFQLLFQVTRDIRLISERLSLIVTGLASTAKIDPELESDDHGSDQYDPLSGSTLTSAGLSHSGGLIQGSSADGSATSGGGNTLRATNQRLFLTNGLDPFSAEIVNCLDPTNFAELDRILRLTCPVSPVALCTTLKRHFDRPLFIMLDALAQRRTLSEHASSAADWLLRCLSPFDPFGGRNLPLPTSPLLAAYYLGANGSGAASSGDAAGEGNGALAASHDGFLFGGFGANTDIGRLLEPLLFILLHPNTSRLSVHNSNILRYTRQGEKRQDGLSVSYSAHDETDGQSFSVDHSPGTPLEATAAEQSNSSTVDAADNVDESKIYAISSTNGNVIYHVRAKPPLKGSSTAGAQTAGQAEMSPSSYRSASPNVTLMTNISNRSPSGVKGGSTSKVFNELVDASRLGDLPASLEHRFVAEPITLVVNPFDNLHNKSLPGHVENVFASLHSPRSNSLPLPPPTAENPAENVIQTVVKQVVSELINSVDGDDDDTKNKENQPLKQEQKESEVIKPRAQTISTSTPTSAGTRPTFPGMATHSASKAASSPTASAQMATPGSATSATSASSTKINISHLHLHLLLYERQYDSARTIYALDTILNMIETWPNRMLYSMATSTFGEGSSPTAPGGFLDGTRSAHIQSLYMKHRNSIQGRGFYYQPPPPAASSQHYSSAAEHSSSRSLSFKVGGGSGKRHTSNSEDIRHSHSILHHISLLELIVQTCLQYLRSYYPSCPSSVSSDRVSKSTGAGSGLEQLFSSLKNSQSTCIDLDSIYGNQRVRLMACEILRIVFQHLSSMIDQSNSSLLGSVSSSSGRFFSSGSRSKGDTIAGWAAHLRPFAQYIHDMLLRCEVQRMVLQCLVTSVWHYQQKQQPKTGQAKGDTDGGIAQSSSRSTSSRVTSSYLYPTLKSSQSPDPAANAFINEILEFNDYPGQIAARTMDTSGDHYSQPIKGGHHRLPRPPPQLQQTAAAENENDAGFHDEFEKCLLRLLEQVMILECRVASTAGAASASSSASSTSVALASDHFASPHFKFQRFQTELTELRFDPNVCLAGQALLHGAIQLALQQNFRRHIHSTWLAFVESTLPYAGRYLSRLVLCVLNQLCRNLDSSQEEIERCSVTRLGGPVSSIQLAPFSWQHVTVTLQSVTMLLSHCLLDRAQLEPLLPYLHEMFEDNNDEVLKTFGLAVHSGRRRRRQGRFGDQDAGGIDGLPSNGNGSSGGPIQIISSIFHNLMVVPMSSNGTSGNGGSGNSSSGASSNSDGVFGIPSEGVSDSPAVLEARKSILGVLNRVIVSLFNVWCTMVVVGEDPTEVAFDSTLEDSTKNLGMCSHYYMHFPRHSSGGVGGNHLHTIPNCPTPKDYREYLSAVAAKSSRFAHSSCSSGWHTASNTGWYIMGTAAQVKKSIMILLSIVSASHGPCLMASLAQVWADLRDGGSARRSTTAQGTAPTSPPTFNYFNGAIDLVIAPVSNSQRQLIQLLRSLSPIFSLETLIQTIRSTLKMCSTGSNSTATATTTTASSFYLTEVALLEIFLAYIRSYPGNMLLKSWRSINSLIKDAHSMNSQATIPLSIFLGSQQQSTTGATPSGTVSINIQPLINFHLLAILHEFLFYAPLCEDRRAQKEMQDVANRLIESLISVAGSRLSHSRWTLRRNLEVLPMSSGGTASTYSSSVVSPTEQSPLPSIHSLSTPRSSPVVGSNRHSTGYRTDDASETETESAVSLKRGLFRNSGSVSFPERSSQRTSTASTVTLEAPSSFETASLHSNFDQQAQQQQFSANTSTYFTASASSDSLISGIFSLGFPTSSSNSQAELANSAQMLFDNFFCVKALYALSEFAAPVLDVVYPSEENEKMIPLIVNLMSYVVPYLRAHMPHNWPCFDACSRLLASLTDYQYTRKAWRRETLDLLLDGAFFQMPAECMPAWRTIVDRVMTHDKNTFREFLARMAVAQSPSSALKIFVASSTIRDQEAELKAQLVKRLAFILFCSEKDQYQRYMSEIQEKLIEIHRTSQSPLVQAQVLLAFRVIILRMSPHHLASLWPFIYTEMFQVFLNIENTLLDYIKANDQRFLFLRESNESKSSVASTLSEILNSFSGSATPAPTPTQTDSILSFVEAGTAAAAASAANLDTLSVGGLSTRVSIGSTLKFKPSPPSQTGSNKKSTAHQLAILASQTAAQQYEPIISPAQLQLFLNACKLLDLALILPSDTLPIFQLHRWSFVGDAISFHNSNISGALFDLGTLFSASASSAALVSDVNATPVSGRHQMEQQHASAASDTSDSQSTAQMSMHSSHSASNLESVATGTEAASSGAFDSLSLNSGISGHESGHSSLPPLTGIGTVGGTSSGSNRPYPNFIPHIVFLNSLLNYLSNNSVKPVPYTFSSPILTISSIESVHNLHGFFQALLARSSRSPSTAMITPSDVMPASDCLSGEVLSGTTIAASAAAATAAATSNGSKQSTPMMFKRNPKRTSKGTRASGRLAAKRIGKEETTSTTSATPTGMSSQEAQSGGQATSVPSGTAANCSSSSAEFCSLDDLFINIDRIIANDFLEPLPSEAFQQS